MSDSTLIDAVISYLKSNWAQLAVSCVIGLLIGYFLAAIIRNGMKKAIRKLDNVVLAFSFLGAAFCLYANVFLGKENISIQLLSFYTSFIFAWLLTKKSAKEEFEVTQHKVAKNTFRHIEDVETAVLVTRDRLYEIKDKEGISDKDIEGILDNVEIILTGIRSNKDDWMDMLKPSYVKKLKAGEDPEEKLLHLRDLKSKGKRIDQPGLDGFSKIGLHLGNGDEVRSKEQ